MAAAPKVSWDQIELAPLVIITGKERVLADRAVARLRRLAEERDASTSLTKLDAEHYTSGTLATITSPSLFGEPSFILVGNVGKMNAEFTDDVLAYIASPEADAIVVLRFDDGQRGAKVIAQAEAAGFQHCDIPVLKNDGDKIALVNAEVRRAKRRMAPEAVEMLVAAVGQDLGELLAGVNQLLTDCEGDVTEEVVRTYFSGRIEASGFDIADAAVAGNKARAIDLARHAFNVGVDPVPIVGALAMKLRQIALVKVDPRRKSHPGDPFIVPFARKYAEREARLWSSEGLAHAILAVAEADAGAKGGAADPRFAVERAILAICEARKQR